MKSIYLAGLLPLLAVAQASTLFEDTFDRADSRNIQEVLDGIDNQTGTAFEPGGDPSGTPVYLHGHIDPASGFAGGFAAPDTDPVNGASARIVNNTLELAAEQQGTSNAIINHNFTNASILAAGGFSVSLDVRARGTVANGNGGGFALGMSLAEALATGDAFSGNPRLTGGLGSNIGAGNIVPVEVASDFWIILRANGSLAWGGAAGTTGIFGISAGQGIPNTPFGTITVNFLLDDFDAGGTVNYEVFYNGDLRGTGSFTWSGTNENYIGLEGRNGSGVNLDNLRIATDFFEPEIAPPFITAFEATTLGGGFARLHWDIGGGPFDVVIKAGSTTLHTSTDPRGFADVDAQGATDFTLTVSNAAGDDFLDTFLAAENGFSTVVRADGPVAWYRFNETFFSSLVIDSADNATPHNGTLIGGVLLDSPGTLDGAAGFLGADASVLAGFILDPAAAMPGYTIEAIVRRYPASPVNAAIVSQNDGTGTGRSHLAVDSDGTIQTFLAGGPPQRKDADVRLPPNVWAHLVMVVDTVTPEIRWYLDGELIGSTADGINPENSVFDPNFTLESATGAWRIGTQKLANQNFWLGDMDEVAVYDFLLDDPDGNGNLSDNRVPAHASAWLGAATGLLGFHADAATILPGGSTTLHVKVGADVTSITIDNGVGAVMPVNGVASVIISPAETTTYTITVQSPGSGQQTQLVTIVVEAVPQEGPEIVSAAISDGDFHIVFRGAPSMTYQVRGSLDLEAFDIDLGTAATDGDGEGSATIPLVPGRSRQFYRIEGIPAP